MNLVPLGKWLQSLIQILQLHRKTQSNKLIAILVRNVYLGFKSFMYRQIFSLNQQGELNSNVYVEVLCNQLSLEKATSGIFYKSAFYFILEVCSPITCLLHLTFISIIAYAAVFFIQWVYKREGCFSVRHSGIMSLLKHIFMFSLILVVSRIWADYFNRLHCKDERK